MRVAALGVVGLLVVAAAVLPGAGAAGAATLEPGAFVVLTGEPSLLAAFPEPVGNVSVPRPAAVSQDGRFVVFNSTSDGLAPDDDDNVLNVYVKDRQTGAVTFATRANGAAGEPAHASCLDPTISDDGTRVAFTCLGALDPDDTNDRRDVYVRDLTSATTFLISRATGLGAVGNGDSNRGVLSQTGQFVAFDSQASNLGSGGTGGKVLRREIGNGDATITVSRKTGPNGTPGGGNDPSISDDGNRIAFAQDHNGFYDAADTNNVSDIFVHDESADTTVLASREDGAGDVGNGASTKPVLAGDGSSVAFESTANQFDFQRDPDTQPDVYRRGLAAGTTALVDVKADGTKGGVATSPAIDDSGDVVAFVSTSTSLDPADTDPRPTVYFKNLMTNELQLAGRADGPDGAAAQNTSGAAVSGDGTKIVTNTPRPITPDADPRENSLVLRDLVASSTSSVSRPPGTAPFRNEGGNASDLDLSADGRLAAFRTEAAGFGLPDEASNAAVVRDLASDTAAIASREDGAGGAVMTGGIGHVAISPDGSRVAFTVFGAAFGETSLFVRDLATGRTFLASRADGGAGAPADGFSQEPVLDADGSRVAFATTATNLGDGDTDPQPDVHLRDLDAGRTLLVSRADGAAGAKGDGASGAPAISDDGTRVAFRTRATNLGDGDADMISDMHLRDLAAETTTLVSATPGGVKSDGDIADGDIDASGTRVAFTARSTNLLGVGGMFGKVFVRDLAADTLILASRADGAGGAPADGDSGQARISPDGGHVSFASVGTNLAAGVSPVSYEAYRRDLAGGRTDLVTPGTPPANVDIAGPVTRGGACVGVTAIEHLLGPRVDGDQGYLRVFERNCGRPDPPPDGGDGLPGGGGTPLGPTGPVVLPPDTDAPQLTDARLSRTRFRVGPQETALTAAVGRGTVLRFSSSEAARLTLRFARPGAGRRTRGAPRRCRPVRKRPRRRACTAFRREGTLTRQIEAGPGRLAFSGRIGRRALRRGRHRLTLFATDAAGNRSRAVRLRFRIVQRKRAG